MSSRTGLGPLETALLRSIDLVGAQGSGSNGYARGSAVLNETQRSIGIEPTYAYAALCDLANPRKIALPLVYFDGNYGSADVEPAAPDYVACRLSPIGRLALDAERQTGAPVPIGLINGTIYSGGLRPPFDASRVLSAFQMLSESPMVDDHDLLELVGEPSFPTLCEVLGDIAALLAGSATTLTLRAKVDVLSEGIETVLLISRLPPGVGATQVVNSLASMLARPEGASTGRPPVRPRPLFNGVGDQAPFPEAPRIVCTLEPEDLSDALERLQVVGGVVTNVRAALPKPMAALLREWHASGSGVSVGYSALRQLVRQDE